MVFLNNNNKMKQQEQWVQLPQWWQTTWIGEERTLHKAQMPEDSLVYMVDLTQRVKLHKGIVHFDHLGEPTKYNFMWSGKMKQLERSRDWVEAILKSQVNPTQPFPLLLALVADRKIRWRELGWGARLVKEVSHLGKLDGLRCVSGVGNSSLYCRDRAMPLHSLDDLASRGWEVKEGISVKG